jgi:hypothetical protein
VAVIIVVTAAAVATVVVFSLCEVVHPLSLVLEQTTRIGELLPRPVLAIVRAGESSLM